MPKRDITGKCEGECRNLVREAEEKRQHKLKKYMYTNSEGPQVKWARSRSEQPGFFGGHV